MILRFVLSVIALALAAFSAQAEGNAIAFETQAHNAILIDAKSGYVFFEKDADTAIPPASMSKLMTQAIVFDMLKRGDLKLDQEVLVSADAVKRGGQDAGSSTMFAAPNSMVSVDDLIHGAIIQSANDACIALAENIAGTEAAFAQRMMSKAQELGLKNSNFANATGLPDPGQRMSVRDLAMLARYIIQTYPENYKIYSEPQFTWSKITQQNRNPLLKDYPGADGMKTGYTKEAGYGLVGSAIRNGRRLIMVVAGLDSVDKRKAEAQKLLDFGFSQFRSINVYDTGDVVTKARVWGGEERWVNLVTPDPFQVSLAPFEQDKADMRFNYTGPLLAPVKAGTRVGTVKILIDGKAVAEAPLQTAADVNATPSMWKRAADSALIMLFGG
ncbi:MAG: D-alanyl-D-alanine carboxypeptidase family protein [Aestuariivirga sp.]